MTYHNYIAVIGRLPGDDEDSMILFENMTRQQAEQAFEEEMYEDEIDATEKYNRNCLEPGCAVFINHILTSDSPITEI